MISKFPTYNLGAVLRETNLKADVLRAWERRYSIPSPERTAGGHRLYSDYDIASIKWLISRQTEGLSISRAAKLWKEISEAGRDPLVEFIQVKVGEQERNPAEGAPMDVMRREWLTACMAFDNLAAENILYQAFAMYAVEKVCTEILQRGLSEVGDLWRQGKVTVQQEHFVSAQAVRRLEALITATPNPIRRETVIIGCPPGEWHVFPVLLLSLLLRRRGFNVVYLGADVPLEQLEQTITAIQPALIVLSAQQLAAAATLRDAASMMQKAGIALAYGGLIFNRIPELRAHIPAFFLGENLGAALDGIERIITASIPSPSATKVSKVYQDTAAIFQKNLPKIEAWLARELPEQGMRGDYMRDVNTYFVTGLLAALELGDLHLIESDFAWVKKLLTDRQISAEMLVPYLDAFRQAVTQELGAAGELIVDWLDSYLGKESKSG